jgi:hypothetical protein
MRSIRDLHTALIITDALLTIDVVVVFFTVIGEIGTHVGSRLEGITMNITTIIPL